jgi:hypothetical protein
MNRSRAEPTPCPRPRCRQHKPRRRSIARWQKLPRPPGVYQESLSQNKEYTEAIANGKTLSRDDQALSAAAPFRLLFRVLCSRHGCLYSAASIV